MQHPKVRQRLKAKQEAGFQFYLLRIDDFQWGRLNWLKNLPILPKEKKSLSDLNISDLDGVLNTLVEHISRALSIYPPINEGILARLELNAIGPFKQLIFNPGQRLNIITGDNGFGKTLLLECAWWALSGLWPQYPVYPQKNAEKNEVKINFQYMTKSGSTGKLNSVDYDWENPQWPNIKNTAGAIGLVIYARVDGSFTTWDPVRAKIPPPIGFNDPLSPLFFDTKQIVDGIIERIPGKEDRFLCNGLLLDWINWQRVPDSPFRVFERILEKLSSTSQEPLKP